LILALILALNWNTILQRVSTEQKELGTVVTEGLNQAPLTSATYRLHLWEFGLNKWLERPFTGWGPGTTHALVEAENNPALRDNRDIGFDHLHNAYLELVFQLGLIGIMLVSLICGLMVSKIIEAYQKKRISIYFLAFLFSNFVLIAVYSLTDFRHLHWNWRFYWMMLAGISFSFSLMTFRPRQNHMNGNRSVKAVIVPAGTLDDDPGIKPSQNIFATSGADWFEAPEKLPHHDALPIKK
jgi:O-antigen ligase